MYDASILILSLAFVYPTTYLFNIGGWVKCFKKCRAKGNEKTTQREANELCEGVPVDVANNISNYMNCVCTCIFYSPLIPHAIPIAMVGSIYSYWVYKYMFCFNPKEVEHAIFCVLGVLLIMAYTGHYAYTNLQRRVKAHINDGAMD